MVMDSWQDPRTIALWISIIAFFVVILVLAIVFFVKMNFQKVIEAEQTKAKLKLDHQKELLESSIRIQERERSRIATDLHDALIGKLSAILMINQTESGIPELNKLLSESIGTARQISHDLRPPLIDYSSLSELIQASLNPWKRTLSIEYYKDIRVECSLPSEVKIHLIRILQEVMNNIIKHSGAKNVKVHLRQTSKWVVLIVRDDGKGFDVSKKSAGLGLQNIEIRMKHIEGVYKIKSRPNYGTTFFFIAPI